MSIKCWLAHDWEYYDYVGMQNQPTKKVCLRCGKIKQYVGDYSMLWRKDANNPDYWKTAEQINKEALEKNERWAKAQKLLNK